jgi:hypothetical protein
MPDRQEIERSLFGVWRLAMLDPGGLRWLNLSVDGFWRSFWVIPLLLPVQLLLAWLIPDEEAVAASGMAPWLLFRALLSVLTWVGFVVAMIPVCRLLRLGHAYVTYVIAWNWSALPQAAVLLAAALVYGLLPESAGVVLLLAVQLAVLAYIFLVTRYALGTDGLTAAGVVIFNVLFELVIVELAGRLLLAGPQALPAA